MKNFWTGNIVVYTIFDKFLTKYLIVEKYLINCPHNTVQIDVLRIKPTVLYDTNSVIRKHFSTKFTVQYKPSQAKLGEFCPPPGSTTSSCNPLSVCKLALKWWVLLRFLIFISVKLLNWKKTFHQPFMYLLQATVLDIHGSHCTGKLLFYHF